MRLSCLTATINHPNVNFRCLLANFTYCQQKWVKTSMKFYSKQNAYGLWTCEATSSKYTTITIIRALSFVSMIRNILSYFFAQYFSDNSYKVQKLLILNTITCIYRECEWNLHVNKLTVYFYPSFLITVLFYDCQCI